MSSRNTKRNTNIDKKDTLKKRVPFQTFMNWGFTDKTIENELEPLINKLLVAGKREVAAKNNGGSSNHPYIIFLKRNPMLNYYKLAEFALRQYLDLEPSSPEYERENQELLKEANTLLNNNRILFKPDFSKPY